MADNGSIVDELEGMVFVKAAETAALKRLEEAVKELIEVYTISLDKLNEMLASVKSIERDLDNLTDEREKLKEAIARNTENINDKTALLESEIKSIKSTIFKSPELEQACDEVLITYDKYSKHVSEEEIMRNYPHLYKFVSVIRQLEAYKEKTKEDIDIYKTMEGKQISRTKQALMYYFTKNYEYAKVGSTQRLTITFVAKRFGIKPSTISQDLSYYIRTGIVVNIYDPITKKYEKEFAEATTRRDNTLYRNLRYSESTYKHIVERNLAKKHYTGA